MASSSDLKSIEATLDSNSGIRLHPDDDFHSGNGKKRSQSSLDFGRGERRSPSPERKNKDEMLKYVTSSKNKESNTGVPAVPVPISTGSSANMPRDVTNQDPSTSVKLPQRFVVKYLGFRETSGLWGIKYTRKPVDEMVQGAKTSLAKNPEKGLALLKLEVTEEGISVAPMPQNTNPICPSGKFLIESISYGLQDLVYTRVFAFIVVKTNKENQQGQEGQNETKLSKLSPSSSQFRCHAVVTDSRSTARRLTYALASAFEIFSKKVKEGKITSVNPTTPKKFAIDLRSTEELEQETELGGDSSEA